MVKKTASNNEADVIVNNIINANVDDIADTCWWDKRVSRRYKYNGNGKKPYIIRLNV